jgi:methionyl-tRNA formyltransferase
MRRVVARTRRAMEPPMPREIPGGEPLPPLVLDPGVTSDQMAAVCRAAGVEWRATDEIRSGGFLAEVRRAAPSLILSAAFPFIFPRELLDIPAVGAINFHPSLLPRCRGCHPIFWTLASGETQGGVTAHFMTEQVDAGNIIAQIPLALTQDDDYGSLYRRAMVASADLVGKVESFLIAGAGRGEPQDHARATSFHEDGEEDHRIHWARHGAAEIVALTRTGEAFTTLRGVRLGILKAREQHTIARERRTARPGRVIAVVDETLVLAALGGPVVIHHVAWRGMGYRAGSLARAIAVRRGEVLG